MLKQMDKSPTSDSTRNLITNSSKYGLTTGSYNAEWIELTQAGAIASNPKAEPKDRLGAQFELAIENIAPFKLLYDEYKGKKLPIHEVLKDKLIESSLSIDNPSEYIDLFVVNMKYLGVLQTIAGAETIVSIEQVIDEIQETPSSEIPSIIAPPKPREIGEETTASKKTAITKADWGKTCFVITPIGEDGSEVRQHADLFLSSIIEPALKEFGLDVVRADKIGAAGMITSQILEYVMRSRLAIVDLSFHNPNAFYEMAIRHACKMPMVQITRKKDKPPFDVNQVRTVIIDTETIYSLVPRLETYRSEIATQVRAALSEGAVTSNPITVFFPGFEVIVPAEG